jgi:hypothetical protein
MAGAILAGAGAAALRLSQVIVHVVVVVVTVRLLILRIACLSSATTLAARATKNMIFLDKLPR